MFDELCSSSNTCKDNINPWSFLQLSDCWPLRMETKMHLDRGQLTWPHRSSSCSNTVDNKNKVILQNNRIQEPCTKCSWLPLWIQTCHNNTITHQTQRNPVACQTSLSNYPLPFPQHQPPVIISCFLQTWDYRTTWEYNIQNIVNQLCSKTGAVLLSIPST